MPRTAVRRALAPTALLLAAALSAGCASTGFPGSGPIGQSAAPPATTSLPHLTDAIQRIPARVEALLAETGVPGLAVAVVHDGRTVYAEGFGVASLDTGAPVDADTVFQLASVSKPIGASVIAAAGTAHGFDWQQRVSEVLPEFALADPWVTEHLTIGDLYSHRSGLPDHAGDDLASLGVDRATILQRLRELPLAPFRAHYAYTNLGIMAGALAATEAAGADDWSTLSEEQLYAPLGMDRTTSRYGEYLALPNHAVGHTNWGGEWIVHPEPLDDDLATAAGGVASSVHDVARWLAHVLDAARDDSPGTAMLRAAMSTQSVMTAASPDPLRPTSGYGFGFQTGMLSGTGVALVSHSGAFAQGAGTNVSILPEADLAIVVLTNGYPIGLAETISTETLDLALDGELVRDWWATYREVMRAMAADFDSLVAGAPRSDAPTSRDLADYEGRYVSDYFGLATVERVDTGLELLLEPVPGAGQRWRLEPWSADTFRVRIDNEDATPDSVSAVWFDPVAGTMRIEFFDWTSGGAGEFELISG